MPKYELLYSTFTLGTINLYTAQERLLPSLLPHWATFTEFFILMLRYTCISSPSNTGCGSMHLDSLEAAIKSKGEENEEVKLQAKTNIIDIYEKISRATILHVAIVASYMLKFWRRQVALMMLRPNPFLGTIGFLV